MTKEYRLSDKMRDHVVELSYHGLLELLRGEHHFKVDPGIPEDAVLVGVMLPAVGQRGDILTLLFDRPVPQPIVHPLTVGPTL